MLPKEKLDFSNRVSVVYKPHLKPGLMFICRELTRNKLRGILVEFYLTHIALFGTCFLLLLIFCLYIVYVCVCLFFSFFMVNNNVCLFFFFTFVLLFVYLSLCFLKGKREKTWD